MALSFLFPKPTLVPPTHNPDASISYFGGDFVTWDYLDGIPPEIESSLSTKAPQQDGIKRYTSRQLFKAGSKHTGAGRESTATPPYHYHYYQYEEFKVKSGTMCYKINGLEGKIEAGDSIISPPYQKHTFWNDPTTGTDLDVYITVWGGPNPGFDADFVKSFYGYVSSMTMSNQALNPLQMLKFLASADVALADIPCCYWLGPWLNFIGGTVLGGWIAGFQDRYKMFSDKTS